MDLKKIKRNKQTFAKYFSIMQKASKIKKERGQDAALAPVRELKNQTNLQLLHSFQQPRAFV